MNLDFLYSCVMGSTWFFLSSWLLVLLGACVIAFRRDWTGANSHGGLGSGVSGAQSNQTVPVRLSR
jgi:hypothetical protein